MAIAERASRASSPDRRFILFPAVVLLAGCGAITPEAARLDLPYRDPAIPEIEHSAIVRALNDLAGAGTHGRLRASAYFDEMGPALGVRLVPYWVQLLDYPDVDVRLAVARLIIRFCGRGSVPLLVDFLEWDNEAVRRDAYDKLRLVTGSEFGYRYDAPEDVRREVVRQIRRGLGGVQPRSNPAGGPR